MKRQFLFLLIAAAFVALGASFFLGQVSAAPQAATGCFPDTNNHWAEAFICWASQKGLVGGFPNGTYGPEGNVTRAQIAVLLQNQATKGETLVSVGPTSWVPLGEGDFSGGRVLYSSNSAKFLSGDGSGGRQFVASAHAPVAVNGNVTAFKGVKLCYTASSQASLFTVFASKIGNQNNGQGSPNASVTDATNRTGDACRTYLVDAPLANRKMGYGEHVAIVLTIAFANNTADLKVSSATFIFETTIDLAAATVSGLAAPEEAQVPIMPLSEFPVWAGLDTTGDN